MDETRSNPALDKEKAEGSRETVEQAIDRAEEQAEDKPQGVTNQPLEEERRQQQKVPPRGQRKGNVSA
ncbi:MAG: hypothetical protein ACREJG_01270 [Candidatus Rokuibacteriota bacterium]